MGARLRHRRGCGARRFCAAALASAKAVADDPVSAGGRRGPCQPNEARGGGERRDGAALLKVIPVENEDWKKRKTLWWDYFINKRFHLC